MTHRVNVGVANNKPLLARKNKTVPRLILIKM